MGAAGATRTSSSGGLPSRGALVVLTAAGLACEADCLHLKGRLISEIDSADGPALLSSFVHAAGELANENHVYVMNQVRLTKLGGKR